MPVFYVNYDLRAPGRDYARTDAGIARVSSDKIRPLESCWLVSTPMNRVEIFNVLREYIDPNDRLLIFEVKCDEWIACGLDATAENWLRRHAALEAGPLEPLGLAALNDLLPPPPLRLGDLLPPPPRPPSLNDLLPPPPSSAAQPGLGERILRHARGK